MRLLVTGGAGFIGSHFVEKCLALGHEPALLDDFNDFYDPAIKRANTAAFAEEVETHEIDIRDTDAVLRVVRQGKFDAIVHLAARAGVRPSIQQPRLYLETNVMGTWSLLEAARLANVPRFINASSSSVYGVLKTVPFREDMPLHQTISPYASTKLAAEQLCSNYAHLYGLRTVSLRFFTVYGPRQRPDLAIHSFTRNIWEGIPIRKFGDGSTRRDYTYIDDVIEGMAACLKYEGALCEVFNLGENETTTLNELISTLERVLGRTAVIEELPEQPGDVPLTFADITKARAHLGYSPQTKIADGIPKFVEWFHEHCGAPGMAVT
jgi:UDP-glucuronate 4-epimerase